MCFKNKKLDDEKRQRLDKVLKIAAEIATKNPAALKDFMKLLGRKYQSECLCKAVSALNEHKVSNLEPSLAWFDTRMELNADNHNLHDVIKKVDVDVELNLATDLVMPWPWNMDRVVNNLSYIGGGESRTPWRQDNNHRTQLWLPFGIAWVYGGNHSMMSGIVQGQGVIKPEEVYDASPLFKYVKFDGINFIRLDTGNVIGKPADFEFACIFEVGRFMHEKGISCT